MANELNIANTEAQASNYAANMDYQKEIDVANTNGIYNLEKQNLANEGNANVQYIKNAGNLAVQQSKNSSSGKSSSGSSKEPLTESQVKAWADYLNNDIASKYGSSKQAVKEVSKNQYQRADADADYIIIRVFSSDDLTQEQKEYLLYDKFGITEDQVNTAMKDRHCK